MSAASASRWVSATSRRCASTSGRRPAFQASMNSLRIWSGFAGTEDPLHLPLPAAAPLVEVVHGDAEAAGDRGAVQLLQPRQLQHRAVALVAHLADGPRDEPLGLLAALLGGDRVLLGRAALGGVGRQRGVVRAGLAARVEALVQAARAAAPVAELAPAVVEAGIMDRAVHRRAELAELALAEASAHRDDAQVALGRGAAHLIRRQPGPAGEAKGAAQAGDAVEVVHGQLLPELLRLVRPPAVAGGDVPAQQQVVGL